MPGTFRTIDGRAVTGINDAGQIVGNYLDASGLAHGFLLSGDSFTIIDVPGADATAPFGINNAGQIVGFYATDPTAPDLAGFLFSEGRFSTIDFPGADLTTATGINSSGQIVGSYGGPDCPIPGVGCHGFLLSGGRFSTVDVPGAPTVAFGINDLGQSQLRDGARRGLRRGERDRRHARTSRTSSRRTRTAGESPDAAVATAAYRVLVSLFPAQQTGCGAQYDDSLAAIPDGRAKRGGIAVGARPPPR